MAKRDATEEALDRLSSLKAAADDHQLGEELKAYLAHRSNLVVAKAAKIARERALTDLMPELVTAFERFMEDPQRLDKRCAAVTELAIALYEFDYVEPDVYRSGIHHVQMEASFGPPVDVAAALRGICARGLLRTRDPRAAEEVVSRLADSEVPARLGAVKALATNGGEAGALLLRFKALVGDEDSEVFAECLAGLLAMNGTHALDFVARFVDSEDVAISESAILVLGSSRVVGAIEILSRKWERTAERAIKKTLLLAFASSREDSALDFLLSLLETSSAETACETITALSVHKTNERLRQAVSQLVDKRRERQLIEAFRREFAQ